MLSGASRGSPSGLRWGAVAGGLVVTFGLSLALAGALAAVLYARVLTATSASPLLLALGLLSLALGAGYAAHLARTMGWAHGLAVGLCYVAVSLALQPLLFAGGWTAGGALQRVLFGALAGSLGGVVGVNL